MLNEMLNEMSKKKDFENFHLYFLYISNITEERLSFRFDNKYGFLD